MKLNKKKQVRKEDLFNCSRELYPKIETVLSNIGFQLLELSFTSEHQTNYLRVTIKHPEHSVSLKDCELVSKKIEQTLDEEDLVPFSYSFEVQSSGTDSVNKDKKDEHCFTLKNSGLIIKA